MKARLKRLLTFGLKACVSGALIVVLILKVDLTDVGAVIQGANWTILGLAFCMFFLAYSVTAARWKTLLRALGHRIPFWYLIRSFLVGLFFSNFLPSTVGGDAIRMYDSWRVGATKTNSIAAVLMDRFMGLIALLLFASMGLYLGHFASLAESKLILVVACTAVAGLFLLGVMIFMPTAFEKRASALLSSMPKMIIRIGQPILGSLRSFRSHRSALLIAFLYSVVLQTNVVLYHWVVGYGLGFDVPLNAYFLIVPVAIVIMMIPISINAIGVREGLFVVLLGAHGVTQAEGLAYAWIVYAFLVAQSLIGGVLFIFRKEQIPAWNGRSALSEREI